jgi:alginate O-acetyltransferase complex protein AlgJ
MTGRFHHAVAERPDARPQRRFAPAKAVRGRDGWLFLDSEALRIMDQVQGRLLLSSEQLREWQSLLERRTSLLAERGAHYLFLVAPSRNVVFPEKAPQADPGAERPIRQLLRHLESERSFAPVVYPLRQLMQCRNDRTYTETDNHWTDRGAFIAYRALSDEIARLVEVRRLAESDIKWVEVLHAGDLGRKLRPQQRSRHVYANLHDPEARLVHDNGVLNSGRLVEFECDAAPEGTCLVLGTSSTYALVHLLAEGFRRLVFTHIRTLDHALVDDVSPDLIVTVYDEMVIPVEAPAVTQRQLEARKRASGKVFRVPDGHWRTRVFQRPQDRPPWLARLDGRRQTVSAPVTTAQTALT